MVKRSFSFVDERDDMPSDDDCAEKRAYHNLLERKRRDHIKDSFTSLRDSLPAFRGGSMRASRAQILMKAADCIQCTRQKNEAHSADIDDLRKQNKALEEAIKIMKEGKETGNYKAVYDVLKDHHHYCMKAKRMPVFESEESDDNTSSDPEDTKRKIFKSFSESG